MTVDARWIVRAAQSGDRAVIAEELESLSEKERKLLAGEVKGKLPTQWGHPHAQRLAATLVFTALAPIGEIKREGVWQPALFDHELADEHLTRVVSARSPSVRAKLPEAWLSQPWGGPWVAIRRLVRDGVCPHPSDEARWALAVASGVRVRVNDDVDGHAELLRILQDDPELLEDLGLLFRHEEAARQLSGAYSAEPPDACPWSWVLVQLTDADRLDRAALLDETLVGLERDLPASAVGFAQDVHRRLEVSDDEIAARAEVYLRLITSPVATTQRLALSACRRLVDRGALDGDAFATASAVPLTGAQKNVAVASLQVLERLVGTDPRAAIRGATAGLEHARDDVQERALTLLEGVRDDLTDADRESLLAVADIVSPAVRHRVLELVGVDLDSPPASDEPLADRHHEGDLRAAVAAVDARARAALELDDALASVEAGEWPITPRTTDPLALSGGREVVPIEDTDELVGIVAGLLEGVGTGVDVERAIAAIATDGPRLAGAAGAALSPLAKRATALLTDGVGEFTIPGNSLRADLAMLVRCWVEGRQPPALAHDREHPDLGYGGRGSLTKLRSRLRRAAPRVGSPVNRLRREPGRHTSIPWAAPDRAVPAVAGFAGLRIWEVARLVGERQTHHLLATPTHRSGWIAPEVLVERAVAAAAGGAPLLRFDATQALHRIAPGGHATALQAAAAVPGPFGAAVRTRLGSLEQATDDGLARAAGTVAPAGLRIEKGLVDKGYRAEPVPALVATAGGDPAPPATIDDPVGLALYRLTSPGDLVDGWWGGTAPLFHGVEAASAAWMALTLPSSPGIVPVVAALIAASMSDGDQPRGHPEPLVAHLIEGHPVGGQELAELVAALLLAKAPVLRTLATDLIIARADLGDLEPGAVGRALARLVDIGVGTLARVEGPLRDAAGASTVHAGVVHALLVTFVTSVPGAPRGLDAALSVLRDVSIEHRCPVDDTDARAALEAWSTGSSKRATAARAVLSVEGSTALTDAARTALLGARIAQATPR